jgi:hypothetical protein
MGLVGDRTRVARQRGIQRSVSPSMMAKRKPQFRSFFYSPLLPRSFEPPFYPRLEAHRSIRSRLLNLFVNAILADPLGDTLGSR